MQQLASKCNSLVEYDIITKKMFTNRITPLYFSITQELHTSVLKQLLTQQQIHQEEREQYYVS